MQFKNVLLLYKASAYKIYFLGRKNIFKPNGRRALSKEITRFKKAHDEHYASLKRIEGVLRKYHIRYAKSSRGRPVNYSKYDFIISAGGDGTFLEAARGLKDQLILGVNSSPAYSVGRLCFADACNFEQILRKILKDNFRPKLLSRLRITFKKPRKPMDCLNDILVCHSNPAALCRYYLKIKRKKEEQRSSGVWIATAAGSTGAIQSAGGKALSIYENKMQYLPRELYLRKKRRYDLRGGILSSREAIEVTSLMPKGIIYVDGAHIHFPFEYGSTIKIGISPYPVRTIHL